MAAKLAIGNETDTISARRNSAWVVLAGQAQSDVMSRRCQHREAISVRRRATGMPAPQPRSRTSPRCGKNIRQLVSQRSLNGDPVVHSSKHPQYGHNPWRQSRSHARRLSTCPVREITPWFTAHGLPPAPPAYRLDIRLTNDLGVFLAVSCSLVCALRLWRDSSFDGRLVNPTRCRPCRTCDDGEAGYPRQFCVLVRYGPTRHARPSRQIVAVQRLKIRARKRCKTRPAAGKVDECDECATLCADSENTPRSFVRRISRATRRGGRVEGHVGREPGCYSRTGQVESRRA